MDKQRLRLWYLVLGFGAFGGLLSALYETLLSAGQEPSLGGALYPVYVCFGLAAAVVSVFWLVHVDLTDAPRTAALALLAGLGWKVVISGVPVVIEKETGRFHDNSARTALADAQTAVGENKKEEALSAGRRAERHIERLKDLGTADVLIPAVAALSAAAQSDATTVDHGLAQEPRSAPSGEGESAPLSSLSPPQPHSGNSDQPVESPNLSIPTDVFERGDVLVQLRAALLEIEGMHI